MAVLKLNGIRCFDQGSMLVSGRARSLTLRLAVFHLYIRCYISSITTVIFSLEREDLVAHVNALQTLEGPLYDTVDRC